MLAAILSSAVALAAEPTPLAILGSTDGGLTPKDATRLAGEVVEAAAVLTRFRLVTPTARVLSVGASSARAAQLAKEAGASRVVIVDAAELGDGAVLYLQLLEVPSGRSLGSTTAPIAGLSEPSIDHHRALLRSALVRLLEPDHYVGALVLHIDVDDTDGVEVQVDGRVLPAPAKGAALTLPIGTHALRVTHPRYHDFLRFCDIEFEHPLTLDVPLAAYPLAEGEMAAELRKAPIEKQPTRWYASPWLWAGAAVVLAGVTVGIVYGARHGLDYDQGVSYRAPSGP